MKSILLPTFLVAAGAVNGQKDVEVLVKEASGGNQTAVESCFEVE